MPADTTEPMVLQWLRARQVPNLPDHVVTEQHDQFRRVAHHPSGCVTTVAEPAAYAAPDGCLCQCVVAALLGDYPAKDFFKTIRELVGATDALNEALTCVHAENNEFPTFRAAMLRHHRHYLCRWTPQRLMLDLGDVLVDCPALEAIRKGVASDWSQAEKAHPFDHDAYIDDVARFAVREILRHRGWRELNKISLHLMAARSNLVDHWLSERNGQSLYETFLTDAGDAMRYQLSRPENRDYRLADLDRLEVDATYLLKQRDMIACHVGSSGMDPFATDQGPRSLLIYNGLRAYSVKGGTAMGEYPAVLVEWFQCKHEEKKRERFHSPASGGVVVPICESVLTEDYQWETALRLWEESFADSPSRDPDEDPGPFRDQRTAIMAASAL